MHDSKQKWYIAYFFILFTKLFLSLRHISRVKEKAIKMVSAKPGARVLDVATGAGRKAFAFADEGYRVIGIDRNEIALKRNIKFNKYPNLDFIASDATAMPFGDNEFDVSCASFVLHELSIDIREKVLREMARVTRAQGVILIVDYIYPVNRFSRYSVYPIISFFEGPTYHEFIRSDLKADLAKMGITIFAERSTFFGCAKIYKIIVTRP